MKVAQFLYSGLGGHGSVAFSLIEGDAELRWSNALGFIGVEPLLDDYRRRCEAAGIPYAYFPARRGRPWSAWPPVRDWLNSTEPDAIICHGGPALPPSALHARRRGVPLIAVEHSSMAARRRAEMLYTRIAMHLADAVVVLTEELAGGLRAGLGRAYRTDKVSIIPTGINTDRFHPAKRTDDRPSSVRIGMAGRLTPVKRNDDLIAVARELQRLRPEHGWTLSFAGDGEDRSRLEVMARELAPGVVEFAGMLDEQALADWYRSLDVYVHASTAEALSTSILQAMASELPIVASDVPGVAALLPADAGILLGNGDALAWAEEIASLVASEERMAALGRNARDLCVRQYSHRRMHEAYDELIRAHARR